jgi:hypothetical protein
MIRGNNCAPAPYGLAFLLVFGCLTNVLGQAAQSGKASALITDAEVIRLIKVDLDKLPPGRRPSTVRYLTLTSLYNKMLNSGEKVPETDEARKEVIKKMVDTDAYRTARQALAKMVNSLSWSCRLTPPAPIDDAQTIFRIYLEDFGWDGDTWQRILDEYPYRVVQNTQAARDVYANTGCDQPYVWGNWFVFASSRPSLYHYLLKLPRTEEKLERMLRVDADGDVHGGRVVRALIYPSMVSRSNRLIERHETKDHTYYWKSYDFAGNDGRRNLFTHPMGPGEQETNFQRDGGEIIFELPNGLQAYMIVNKQGDRIDQAPIEIVQDAYRSGAVMNGGSCFNCHAHGMMRTQISWDGKKTLMVETVDQLNDQVKAAGFPEENERKRLVGLYPGTEQLQKKLRQDANHFRKILAELDAVSDGSTDPVGYIGSVFGAQLDAQEAAAEIGVPVEDFRQQLGHSAPLSRLLGPLGADARYVHRDAFTEAFPELLSVHKLGVSRGPRIDRDPPASFKRGDKVSLLSVTPKAPVETSASFSMVVLILIVVLVFAIFPVFVWYRTLAAR